MRKFFGSLKTFVCAFPHFMAFEIIYRFLLTIIGTPVLFLLIKLAMKVSGIKYLSDEHLNVYLKQPVTILFIFIMLFCIGFFSFVELSALAACFSSFKNREKLTSDGMMRTGLSAFKKAFRGMGIFKFLFFMVYMPIAQFTVSAGVFVSPLMPSLKRIFRSFGSETAIAVYIVLQILFIVIIVNRCYSLHFLVLTDRSFTDCSRQSKKLISKKKFKTAVSIIFWSLAMLATAVVITFIISFVVFLIIKGFSKPQKALISSLKVLQYEGRIFSAVSGFISAPVVMFRITEGFFEDVSPFEKLTMPDKGHKKWEKRQKIVFVAVVAVLGISLNTSYFSALYEGNINFNSGILTKTKITAHRGFSKVAPENTMYAFEAALDSGADYIELDVQLTKDAQLVVFHDKTIERTTDGHGKISDYTYEELQKFSAGSWFGKTGEFSDAKIVLFSDVVEKFGDDINFNIEIKDVGNVKLAAEKTAEIIEEYGIENSCYVTSFSYNALKYVKKANPHIKTGIIANVATTIAFTKLKYIDALSMNYIFVNHTVVNNAHQNGKRIFVWTVDTKSDIEKMIALGVDNIITNAPDKTAEIVYSDKVSEKVITVLKTVFGK